jgi:hypothetical protein
MVRPFDKGVNLESLEETEVVRSSGGVEIIPYECNALTPV